MNQAEYETYCENIRFARYDKIADEIHHAKIQGFISCIQMGQTSIKSALMINAGAAIAVLALFTNNLTVFLYGQSKLVAIGSKILYALISWSVGTMFASMAYGASYISQGHEQENINQISFDLINKFWNAESYEIPVCKIAERWRLGSIVLVILSLTGFFAGICFSGYAFLKLIE